MTTEQIESYFGSKQDSYEDEQYEAANIACKSAIAKLNEKFMNYTLSLGE